MQIKTLAAAMSTFIAFAMAAPTKDLLITPGQLTDEEPGFPRIPETRWDCPRRGMLCPKPKLMSEVQVLQMLNGVCACFCPDPRAEYDMTNLTHWELAHETIQCWARDEIELPVGPLGILPRVQYTYNSKCDDQH